MVKINRIPNIQQIVILVGKKNEKASSELEFEVPCVIHEKSEYMNMDGTQVLDKIGTSELLVDNLK